MRRNDRTITVRTTRWRRSGDGVRRGFTLIEIMVTITIIGVLIAIALPVIHRVRENARDSQCRSNLRQIGQALMQYSTRMNYLCSGAWDWKRDGAVTEVGWVADLVKQGTPVGDLLCPSSTLHLSKVYGELMNMDPATNTCADSVGGPDQTLPDGTLVPNPCRKIATVSDKGAFLNEHLLVKTYNTNYAAGWFLVRSEVEIDTRGRLVNRRAGCATTPRERSCTAGPLATARIGTTKVASNVIPIMGCASQAERGEPLLTGPIGEHEQGEALADSYTSGPRDKKTLKTPVMPGTPGISSWYGPWNETLQDYRAFGPQHFGETSCNILFLDISVQPFLDTNGDKLLNNGFAAGATGYTTDEIELPAAQIYSQWSLDPIRAK